jgi:hypothetical protein
MEWISISLNRNILGITSKAASALDRWQTSQRRGALAAMCQCRPQTPYFPSIIRGSPASLRCRAPSSLVPTPGLVLAPRLERVPAAAWPVGLSVAVRFVEWLSPEPEAPSLSPGREPTEARLSALASRVPEPAPASGTASALAPRVPEPGLAPETALALASMLVQLGALPS